MKFVAKAVILLAILGLIVSRPTLLIFLSAQDPVVNLFLWYAIFYGFLLVAAVVLYHRPDPMMFRVGLGILLITFALGVWLYFPASDYAILVVGGNPSTVPTFLTASEDQVLYRGLSVVFGTGNLYLLGILTYVVLPALIFVAGALVIGPRRLASSLGRLMGGA